MRLVHVFVEHPILHLDHTFTYRCYDANVKRGVRVQVPFIRQASLDLSVK